MMTYLLKLLAILAPLSKYIPFIGLFPNVFKIISSVFENLMPFIGQVLLGLTWFARTMWEGFKDVIDDVRTILFVLVVAASASLYTTHLENIECKAEIVEVKKKLMPKNPVRTVPNNSEFKWPWETLFK